MVSYYTTARQVLEPMELPRFPKWYMRRLMQCFYRNSDLTMQDCLDEALRRLETVKKRHK